MRGKAYLNRRDFFDKLRVQGFRCSDCKEPFTDESNRRIEDLWNKGEEIKINVEAYNLVYKRKRNEGGKNEPDNIKITCSKCQITTKIVTARLPIMLVERMDKVIEDENSHGNRKRRYGRSDFVKDSIEARLSYKKVDWPGKIASTRGKMGIFSSHVTETTDGIKAAETDESSRAGLRWSPQEERQLVKLKLEDNVSFEEIGRVLGRSTRAVKLRFALMASKDLDLEPLAHESGVLIEIKKIVKNLYSSDSSELDSKNQEQNTDYLDEKLNALIQRLEDEHKQREAIITENLERMERLMAARWILVDDSTGVAFPLDEVISADLDKDK